MAPGYDTPSLDRFRRDPEAPPSDPLGEATVLYALLYTPALLGQENLLPLLARRDHRAIYNAMMSVPAGSRGNPSNFFSEWAHVLCDTQCANLQDHHFWDDRCNSFLMWAALCCSRHAETEWIEEQYQRTVQDDPRRYAHYHDWRWWLERVRVCAEARQIIAAAQQMADAAWRVPEQPYELAEAQATLARVQAQHRSRFTLEIPS